MLVVDYEKLADEIIKRGTFFECSSPLSIREKEILVKTLPDIPFFFYSLSISMRRNEYGTFILSFSNEEWACKVYLYTDETPHITYLYIGEGGKCGFQTDMIKRDINLVNQRFEFWSELDKNSFQDRVFYENELQWAVESEKLLSHFHNQGLSAMKEYHNEPSSLKKAHKKEMLKTLLNLTKAMMGKQGLEDLQVAIDKELEK